MMLSLLRSAVSPVNTPLRRTTAACGLRLQSTLVVAEPNADGSTLSPATLSAITAASKLHSGPISLLTFSSGKVSVPSSILSVLQATASGNSSLLAETITNAVVAANAKFAYTHIVAPATKFGGNYLGRAGAQLGVSPISDVIEVLSEDTFIRPLYAGNALAKVTAKNSPLKLISIRPTAFDKAEVVGGESATTESLDVPQNELTEWVKENVSKSERPDLGSASVVVSGGRGMKNGENFVLLEALADKLGGAIGASRAAVDAGFVPNDMQVGQTGKVVAPDLYIAVGISGAIQHLSGMKDSKTIVAINKDGDAPIFQVADYGLKADLFDAVPELTGKL